MDLNDLQQQRAEKLARLRTAGIEGYPARTQRTHTIKAVLADFDGMMERGEHVIVVGRVVGARRIMGKLAFAHIEDEHGRIQLWLSRADLGDEWFERFANDIDTFDIIEAHGILRRTKAGEASVFVDGMALLSKAINPPPDKWHGLTDTEARLRERYLDMIVNHDVRENFRTRAKVVNIMRQVLDTHDYLEVETPVLQPIYGGASARPFTTYHNQLHQNLYLRIAVELYLKRMIVGGFERVYEISKVFRNEGVDRTHNPEFTMMECYQAYGDYRTMMTLVEQICRETAVRLTGSTVVEFQGRQIDFGPAWQQVSIPGAILERTGIDILQFKTQPELLREIRARKLPVESKPSWAKQVDELFSEIIQPTLIQPTFIVNHPVELSPLAKRHADNPAITERFEAIVAGMEIGNGYSELNDPFDQEQRFLQQLKTQAEGDDEAHQLDDDYINALMYGMPPTGGLGMGIDRMAMIYANQSTIRDVVVFPHLRPRDS
ncbi:MAG: lysine--tRNA ligase [Roseiflexaceae bacterium]